MTKYRFRDTETGDEKEFDFETMMSADVAGYVTVRGREYRRIRDASSRTTGPVEAGTKPIVSDALGFSERHLQHFESDRKAHGFAGVEFLRDPTEPTFIQVKCDSPQTWSRYVRHRGMADMNSSNGSAAMLSPDQMRRAEELAERLAAKKGSLGI